MENDDLEVNTVDSDSVEVDADVFVADSESEADSSETVESGEELEASDDVATGEDAGAEGVPAILEESGDVTAAADVVELLEAQVNYAQNIQTMSLVGVVLLGVVVGVLVINTVAGFFHDL